MKDRAERLRTCLDTLGPLTSEATGELLIACDGGPADLRARVGTLLDGHGWTTRWFDLPPGGPAKGRNAVIPEARGELILFLNDDVRCEPGLLRAHHEMHLRRPGHAVMGNTRWAPEVCKTPFMHWVAHHDSFYYLIPDELSATWEYFHTMNLSIDRRWFDAGHRFDEQFPDPAFEDTELGYRLARDHGLLISIAYNAILYHVHEYTPETYIQKSRERGRSARRFCGLYPELSDRILGEYEQHAARARGMRGKVKATLGLYDELEQWEIRIAGAFLAGYDEGRGR